MKGHIGAMESPPSTLNRHARRLQEKDRAARVRAANAKLRATVTRLYQIADRDVAATKPDDVSCTKGCAACCNQLIFISLAEAVALVLEMPGAVAKALPKLQAQADAIDEIMPPSEVGLSDEHKNQLLAAWWQRREPCVFLAADNTCSIYKRRPHSCRNYFVTSDPALCTDDVNVHGWSPPGALGGYKQLIALARDETTGNVAFAPMQHAIIAAELHVRLDRR